MSGSSDVRGISIVVCTHNGASRLPTTLRHLAEQRDLGLPWEVVVVDNASTDGTAEVALRCWPAGHPAHLGVVREGTLGLAAARQTGLATARFPYVSFVDDDNHLAPDWVSTVLSVMTADARLGACGGFSQAESAGPLPAWFARQAWSYAVGSQAEPPHVAADVATLWGAGLTVRQTAWSGLAASGFVPRLAGRSGAALSGAEDTELTLALRLAGWHLRYEPGLRLVHALAPHRLTWSHLRRLHRAFGASAPLLDPYWAALGEGPMAGQRSHVRTWWWQALSAVRWLARHPAACLAAVLDRGEGDDRVLSVEGQVGRLGTLLRLRSRYARTFRDVAKAPWRVPQTGVARRDAIC